MGFDPVSGGAVCGGCMAPDCKKITPLSLEALRRMLLLTPEDIKKVTLPEETRTELRSALVGYGEYVLERKLRSLSRLNVK